MNSEYMNVIKLDPQKFRFELALYYMLKSNSMLSVNNPHKFKLDG